MVDQSRFLHAIKTPDVPVPDGLVDASKHPAQKRFNVYRNNVAVALTEALEVGFPVVRQLVGVEYFKALAALFWRAHPPDSPVLAQYGAKFPEFLDRFEPLAKYPYLGDVARLEMALRESYHAADSQAADVSLLGQLTPEALNETCLRLAPSLRLVRSAYPVYSIWRFNREADAPKPMAQAEDVLIIRPGFDPMPRLLGPGAPEAFTALANGATLAEAHDQGSAISEQFDLGGLLSVLLEGNALEAIITAEGAT